MGNIRMTYDETDDRYYVSGDLVLNTVLELRKSSRHTFDHQPAVTVDLSRVGRMDSAGMALLIEWTQTARQQGRDIRFYNIPDKMCAMARVSSLELVLPMYRG